MRYLVATILIVAPQVVHAQASSCAISRMVERPHADVATADQPQRRLPIGGYTLALTWTPQHCRTAKGDATFQCGGGNRFGFTLHGLWPDGVGKQWPQYCRATALLPPAVIRANLCATPSAQLLQHEWAKHGTCMAGVRPQQYFGRSTGLFGRLHFPDMNALSRTDLTAGQFAAAMARVNPGLPAASIRVTATRDGWLDELWLCLDQRFAYERCRADSGGVPDDRTLLIWRGRR